MQTVHPFCAEHLPLTYLFWYPVLNPVSEKKETYNFSDNKHLPDILKYKHPYMDKTAGDHQPTSDTADQCKRIAYYISCSSHEQK
jgi:hypothetical protein